VPPPPETHSRTLKSAIGIPITESHQLLNGAAEMSAVVVQLRDYQNPKDIERMRQALEREAAAILQPFVETVGVTEMIQSDTEQAALVCDHLNTEPA
jgi:hypothetical protein